MMTVGEEGGGGGGPRGSQAGKAKEGCGACAEEEVSAMIMFTMRLRRGGPSHGMV